MSSPAVTEREVGASTSIAHRSSPRVPKPIGAGAAIFVLTILIFGIGGAVWGWLRPTIAGRVVEGGVLDIATGGDAEFVAYGTYALVTLGLGVILGMIAALRWRTHYSLAMMAWVSVCGLIGSAWFALIGHVIGARRAQLQPESLHIGDHITFVPSFAPGIAIVAGAYAAMLIYWFLALVISDDQPERRVD